MKNNLVSAAALAAVLVIGAVVRINRSTEPTPQIALPEVEITARNPIPEIALPEITIKAEKPEITTLTLPEVTISAKRDGGV